MNLPGNLNQPEVDGHYLELATAESAASHDPKRFVVPRSAVGTVIANHSGLLAVSANVVPPELVDALRVEGRDVSDTERYYMIEHAERAAIYKALLLGKSLKGATLYGTRFPCADCARAIIWCGIKRAVFSSGLLGEENWLESQRAALQMMRRAGIKVDMPIQG